MARIISFLLLLCFAAAGAKGQNLVPNGSFEYYNGCPTSATSMPLSPGYTNFPTVMAWVSACGSSDYYHTCGTGSWTVPYSFFGYQPARSGSARVGFYTFGYTAPGSPSTLFDSREYVECKLNAQLQPGHIYHVLFYTVAGEMPNATQNVVGVDKIGAQFTTSQLSVPGGSLAMGAGITSTPLVPITDTQNWTRVAGFYTAAGGEEWLTMGHFTDNTPVAYTIIRPATLPASVYYSLSYYYLDDVVVKDVMTPDSGQVSNHVIYCQNPQPITLSGRAGGDEYQWHNSSTAATFTATAPGTYWVRTWKDTVYYVDTFHVTMGAPPPTLHLQNDTVYCPGSPLVLSANQSYQTYSWNTGANTPAITVTAPGQYILTVTDTCGTQRDTVNVAANPVLQLPRDTAVCSGIALTVSANVNFPAYQWSTGATTKAITITQSGAYVLTVTNSCGQQKDTISVTIQPPVPPPATRDTVLCQGVNAPRLAVTGDSLRWYVPPSNIGVFTQPVINTGTTGTQTVQVSQTRGGCESVRQPVRLDILAKPTVGLGRDTLLCDSTALLVGPAVPLTTAIAWNTGETFSPIVVRKEGYYRITLTNQCGTASDDIWIRYRACDSVPPTQGPLQAGCLYIPTAFTPNSDGHNDRFRITSLCPVQRYHLMIVNRRGQVVFQSNNITDSWDGTFKGAQAGMDTYFYYLEFLKANTGNVTDKLKGDFLLVR